MITGNLSQPYRTIINDGRHTLMADLLPADGGQDLGPNPHELVEAGLTACTLMTMEMYGKRKGWSLGNTQVEVKVLSEGAAVVIGRKIIFDSALSSEQKSKFTEIANKCPIHKLLTAPTTIQTEAL